VRFAELKGCEEFESFDHRAGDSDAHDDFCNSPQELLHLVMRPDNLTYRKVRKLWVFLHGMLKKVYHK
jgi:hypothetical protein